jgi:hypothetical protein
MSTLNQRLEQLIINLKVIAKLTPDQRLLFKNRVVSIRNHYPVFTPVIRTMAGESRDDVTTGLSDLLEDVDRLVNDYLNSPELQNPNGSAYDREVALPVLMSLNRLKVELPHIYDSDNKGLNAAKITYSGDPIPSSKIEESIDNFKMMSRRINVEISRMTKKFTLESQIGNSNIAELESLSSKSNESSNQVQRQVNQIDARAEKHAKKSDS